MNKNNGARMSNLTIRIDENLKQNFIATAKDNDIDASKLVRQFIKKYVRSNTIVSTEKKAEDEK